MSARWCHGRGFKTPLLWNFSFFFDKGVPLSGAEAAMNKKNGNILKTDLKIFQVLLTLVLIWHNFCSNLTSLAHECQTGTKYCQIHNIREQLRLYIHQLCHQKRTNKHKSGIFLKISVWYVLKKWKKEKKQVKLNDARKITAHYKYFRTSKRQYLVLFTSFIYDSNQTLKNPLSGVRVIYLVLYTFSLLYF